MDKIIELLIEIRVDIHINTIILSLLADNESYSLLEATREITFSKDYRDEIRETKKKELNNNEQ